jgi:eukaryotic-like serine/threonine-protein kinase
LLLTGEGHLKVSDFGLLKHAHRLPGDLSSESAIVGTPQYMSPEQARGEPLDERSDIFSLGTTFFYILSGQLPFQKNSPTAVLMQITRQDAPRLCEIAEQVPIPLSVIIGRMMARQREDRYQEVGVILEDLASYERRGLLSPYQVDSFMTASAAPVERPDVETQAYQPAPEVQHDL